MTTFLNDDDLLTIKDADVVESPFRHVKSIHISKMRHLDENKMEENTEGKTSFADSPFRHVNSIGIRNQQFDENPMKRSAFYSDIITEDITAEYFQEMDNAEPSNDNAHNMDLPNVVTTKLERVVHFCESVITNRYPAEESTSSSDSFEVKRTYDDNNDNTWCYPFGFHKSFSFSDCIPGNVDITPSVPGFADLPCVFESVRNGEYNSVRSISFGDVSNSSFGDNVDVNTRETLNLMNSSLCDSYQSYGRQGTADFGTRGVCFQGYICLPSPRQFSNKGAQLEPCMDISGFPRGAHQVQQSAQLSDLYSSPRLDYPNDSDSNHSSSSGIPGYDDIPGYGSISGSSFSNEDICYRIEYITKPDDLHIGDPVISDGRSLDSGDGDFDIPDVDDIPGYATAGTYSLDSIVGERVYTPDRKEESSSSDDG